MFGFTIKRNGIAWSVLIADAFDNTIARASGCIDDSLFWFHPFDQLFDTSLIEGEGQLRL